jgi:hypothetical protein
MRTLVYRASVARLTRAVVGLRSYDGEPRELLIRHVRILQICRGVSEVVCFYKELALTIDLVVQNDLSQCASPIMEVALGTK